jgi:hypothetical protein
VEVVVARDMGDLREALRDMSKNGFLVKLNPAWTVPNY